MVLMDLISHTQDKMCKIVTEESNNESMRMKASSMIYYKNKELKLKILSEYCIKLCYSHNRHMGLNGGFKYNNRKDISKMTKRYYCLQKNKMFNTL